MNKLVPFFSVFLLLSAVSAHARNKVTISCDADPYVVKVSDESEKESQSSFVAPMFTLLQDGKKVGSGKLKLVQDSYDDSFLNAYVWGFTTEDENSVIAVAVPGLEKIVPGTYEGKSDLFVASGEHVADGSTLSCKVVVK